VAQHQRALREGANLRRLELAVTRKLDGLLHGDHQTLLYGPGSERGDSRAYQPGDDARRIDWALTARMNEVHVRETYADREIETWLVVDLSASLNFGTQLCEKSDLALAMTATFGLLGARPGNRTGALIFDGNGTEIIAPRSGRNAIMNILRRIDQRPESQGQPASLADALALAARSARRRCRIVVISDFIDSGPWEQELRRLAVRHDVIVANVSDPREWELPDSGLITFADPETGRRVEVPTSNRGIRERFNSAAAARQAEIRQSIQSSGARLVELSTDRDWMSDVVNFAKRSRMAA